MRRNAHCLALASLVDHLNARPFFCDPFGLQTLVEQFAGHSARIAAQEHAKQIGQATGGHHMQFVVGEEPHGNTRCRLGPGAHGFLAGKKSMNQGLERTPYR